MKNINIPFIAAFTFIAASNLFAQVSVGIEYALPVTAGFSNIATFGLGVSGTYEAPIKDKLKWTAGIGLLSFAGKSYPGGSFRSTSIIPIAGGLKYFFNASRIGLYLACDLRASLVNYGIVSYTPKQSTGITSGIVGSGYYGPDYTFGRAHETKLGVSPGVGYRNKKWDFNGRFNFVGNFGYAGQLTLVEKFSYWGLRAGYFL